MSEQKVHSGYNEEKQRLDHTLDYVRSAYEHSLRRKSEIDVSLSRTRKQFDTENVQDYIDLAVNSILSGSFDQQIRNLEYAKGKPYFARVDFTADGSAPEKLYIGKMSLSDYHSQETIIIDWRAPISNLYYEERLGRAHYTCPDGDIYGDITLKRQLMINDGILENIFDIDITTTDDLLQTQLGANADNRLKEIVSTIQYEQNQIIRAAMWKPLVVQGSAGSGKTTIALHRMAYLIYSFRKQFKPESFMIIAPNKLFLNYISEVLPDLGVELATQTTYPEFVYSVIGRKLKIVNPDNALLLITGQADSDFSPDDIASVAALKSSMSMCDIIDRYINIIEETFIPQTDFIFNGILIMRWSQINKLFLYDYHALPFVQRLGEIKKNLNTALKRHHEAIQAKCKRPFLDEIEYINKNVSDPAIRIRRVREVDTEMQAAVAELNASMKNAVTAYIKSVSQLDPVTYYKNFFENEALCRRILSLHADDATIDACRNITLNTLASGCVDTEDLAPIVYLKFRIWGTDTKLPVKHIVIDEAQDFSPFQIFTIKNIIKDSSFTILGDICQGIHSYRGIKSWSELTELVFGKGNCNYLELERCYRTTTEIMAAANTVLRCIDPLKERFPEAVPVVRHGDIPYAKRCEAASLCEEIAGIVNSFYERNFKSIAVICKTQHKCDILFKSLHRIFPQITKLSCSDSQYNSGLVILTCNLSKGLEFDGVIVVDADSSQYLVNELDAKLLYVSMTRPLHSLVLLYEGEPTPLIKSITQGDFL